MLMRKKILSLILISTLGIYASANASDNIATDFMLINNYNVRQSGDIWERMRQGFQLNYPETSRVRYYEKMYSRNQATFNKVMQNSAIYLYYVLTVVEGYGLPSELALIPIVESNYDTFAINSTGRYDGIWQFVPSTGASFGLDENLNLNNRRNVIKATDAAMLYLNNLHLMFKQWDVAIGAYNWGPGNMYKAVLNSNQQLGNIDYTQLPLREITANYVPKVIALANIIKNPSKFGITLIDLPNKPVFAITTPSTNTSVANIRDSSQTTSQTFNTLNSQYKNSSYVLNNQSTILLPIKNQNIYLVSIGISNSNTQLAQNNNSINSSNPNSNNGLVPVSYSNTNNSNTIPDDAINEIGYSDSISHNSTATSSTLQNAVNVSYKPASDSDIKALNSANASVNTDNKPILIIPRSANNPAPPPSKASDYTVKVSNDTNINQLVDDISINHKSAPTKISQTKYNKSSVTHYKVTRGDTLYSIARKFDVELAELKHTNRIKSNHVQIGQILVIK